MLGYKLKKADASGYRSEEQVTDWQHDVAVLDPAGLNFIQHQGPGQAGGASASIYRACGLCNSEAFPPGVRAAITQPTQAKFVSYAYKQWITQWSTSWDPT